MAYEKKDFPKAFEDFNELAELGQALAQYDLAIMYARGEGVQVNNTYAHAWASLAAANGKTEGASLAEKLAPELTPTSLKISSDIQAQFSQATLDARPLLAAYPSNEAQGQAITRAKQLGWDLTSLEQRESLYRSGHAYSENLLLFN